MDTKTVIFEVNKALKDKFKVACAINNETQKDAMNRLVRLYVDNKGKLKESTR